MAQDAPHRHEADGDETQDRTKHGPQSVEVDAHGEEDADAGNSNDPPTDYSGRNPRFDRNHWARLHGDARFACDKIGGQDRGDKKGCRAEIGPLKKCAELAECLHDNFVRRMSRG